VNKSGTGRTALVIVPTFNERENLPVLAAALMKYPEVSMLVVDDRSPDGTGALADGLARDYPGRIQVMHRTARPGLGRSYIDGIRSVLDRPVDVICQMDSDLANAYIRLVTRLTPHDCTSGYRCWRREALASLPLDRFGSNGYSFLVEMLFAASAGGLTFAEVPITFVERRQGESKLSQAVLVESAITPWRLVASRKAARPTVR
jgi:dolichol-phosphate mannosyltransferase